MIDEAADQGTDLVKAAFSYTLLANVENLTLTGTDAVDATGNDVANVLTGNSGANTLDGLAGDDTLVGAQGNDTLDGGTGADSMSGGNGLDTYHVDDAGDLVVEVSTNQIDTVISTISYTLTTYVENLELVSGAIDGTGNASANTLTGTSLSNVLMGLSGNDELFGLAGADTLNGGIGNDTMTGGNGDDTYIVNALADVVSEAGTNGTDLVESSATFTLGAGVENLTLTGASRIDATGNVAANTIIGNSNNNKITGLAGNDVLTGAGGADRFIFTNTNAGVDTITDFNGLVSGVADGDKLQFAAALLEGTFAYIGDNDFSGGSVNTEARIDTLLGQVVVDTDGDGFGDLSITLTGLINSAQLTAADFLFV